MRSTFLCVAAAGLLCLTGHAADKDKQRLFNTFFLEGNRVTYVMMLQTDRRYTIFTPDGRSISGTYVASDKEIAFPYKGGMRHFEFDFDGHDVKMKPTKRDRPQAGHIIGGMPPIGGDSRAVFVAIQNWRERGLPARPNQPPQTVAQNPTSQPATIPTPPIHRPVTPPVNPPTIPTPVEPIKPVEPPKVTSPMPVVPLKTGPKDITGTYTFSSAEGQVATLRLREGGTFDYAAPDGKRAGGTHLYLNGELNLDSGFWRRHFRVAQAENGLRFSRRQTDVPKLGDPLGEMAPVKGDVVWSKKADTTMVNKAGPVTPIEPPKPVTPLPPPEPTVKNPVTPPKTEPKTAQPVTPLAGSTPQSLAQMAGTYTHQPNPLVKETWILSQDGKFEYRDSNGAKVNGTAVLNNGVIQLKAGEVVRQFTVTLDKDGTLVFSRAKDDSPRILNDLASMSPSVLKSARYEKK